MAQELGVEIVVQNVEGAGGGLALTSYTMPTRSESRASATAAPPRPAESPERSTGTSLYARYSAASGQRNGSRAARPTRFRYRTTTR
jgi:hypothetical protein